MKTVGLFQIPGRTMRFIGPVPGLSWMEEGSPGSMKRADCLQGRIGIRDVFNPTWEGRKRSARARLRHKDSRERRVKPFSDPALGRSTRSCDSTSACDRNRMIININVAVRVAALALSSSRFFNYGTRGDSLIYIYIYYSFDRIFLSLLFFPIFFFLLLLF